MATTRKLCDGSRAVASCPDGVVSFLNRCVAEDDTDPDSPLTRLHIRFCADPQMEDVWAAMCAAGMDEADCREAILLWTAAMMHAPSDPFREKTNPERMAWLNATRKAARTLKALLEEGPGLRAENVIECIPLDGMRWILGLLGVRIVPGETSRCAYNEADDRWEVSEWTVARMQDGTMPLTLANLLGMLLSDLDKGIPSTQTVSKPRDAKADRARYILRVTEWTEDAWPVRLTDEQVATLARVALEDEAITPALANRFRWRSGKSAPLGAA